MAATVSWCDTCGQPIIWAISATSGRRIPLDALPVADGNTALAGNPKTISGRDTLVATVLGPLEALIHEGDLYVVHFVTCPDAEAWKGSTRDERRGRRPLKDHA